MDLLDLLAVQGTLKSLLQHHSSKASVLLHSAFFVLQLSHPYMITGKTIALTRQIFVGKVMSLLFNMLSRLVIAFLFLKVCFPVLCKFWRLYGGVNGDLFQEGLCHTQVYCTQSPCPCSSPLLTHTSTGDTQTHFCRSLCRVSGSRCTQGLFEPSEHLWRHMHAQK